MCDYNTSFVYKPPKYDGPRMETIKLYPTPIEWIYKPIIFNNYWIFNLRGTSLSDIPKKVCKIMKNSRKKRQ